MINKLISLVARLTVGKYLVAGVAKAHNTLDGHRSEIALGILALVHGLKIAGIIPSETAEGIEKALAAILPLTLADKVAKAKSMIDSIVPVVPLEDKQEPPKSE